MTFCTLGNCLAPKKVPIKGVECPFDVFFKTTVLCKIVIKREINQLLQDWKATKLLPMKKGLFPGHVTKTSLGFNSELI